MKLLLIPTLLLLLIISACNQNEHFLKDSTYRETVLNDFTEVEKLASHRADQLFSVFNNQISLEEAEALKFLYAYMPLSDLADYDGNFFLNQVQTALKTRKNMAWGQDIPIDIFRHYVLPPRINNENMDTSRLIFYNELKDRVKGMTLMEAALEVNHWCHEKVIYQPTCERTISPLGAIKSAYGRCGEESTFAVTALRAAGIPARQCYTPRWAHCDDNHAWVEVWIDGTWYYMGACEPEPKFNVAWFDEPVLRAMLVHSKAIGKYKGNEIVDTQKDKFAYMNLIGNYISPKELFVKVLDTDNNPISDANVEFQLYNYAEFYPLSTQKTNKQGLCSFTTGYGDLLIWAHKKNTFGYQKVTIELTDTLEIILNKKAIKNYTESYTMIPPIAKKSKTIVSDSERKNNDLRLAKEDSIRELYVATFIQKNEALNLAKELNLDSDKVWHFLEKSRGNWPNIVKYLKETSTINPELSLIQLELISDKDLRDCEAQVLVNNLKASSELLKNTQHQDLFNPYIFNPRVANEQLTDAKTYLAKKFKTRNISNATDLNTWIKNNITVNNNLNYYRVPITPKGVFELKIADKFSRNLFFVLGCRTLGIPARLEPATNIPQFYNNKKWNDAIFETSATPERIKGFIKLSKAKNINFDPQYRIHFSLAKFNNGKYHTLDYGWDKPLSKFENKLAVDTGNYMLLTGNRQADGSVITKMVFFEVIENKTQKIEIELLNAKNENKHLAEFNTPFSFTNASSEKTIVSNQGTKALIWLDTDAEPSKHVLNDIQALVSELNESKIEFKFIVNNFNQSSKSLLKKYNLPSSSELLQDKNKNQLNNFTTNTQLRYTTFPVVTLIKNGKIMYFNSGYTIGVGEQLLKNQ